ncbi:hypothetical protein JZ751_012969 [Albula glossodonta]|uniref:RGS domain-containing protein n=1 Tax=Albula glossodonta TaxID=121402 RepID=A0A8T2N618_9TELE|nr:hypothetical protein JZ751_012746 [Albula glossodonta]KAG9333248.1 hypothetical protein JZ751_012969 [Albula glossodonta]
MRLWAESFERLIRNPAGRNLFREFLRTEYSEDNLLFWLACEDLKREHSETAVLEKARLIYEDYVSILSPKEAPSLCHSLARSVSDPASSSTDSARSLSDPASSCTESARSVSDPASSTTESAHSVSDPASSTTESARSVSDPASSTTESARSVSDPASSTT